MQNFPNSPAPPSLPPGFTGRSGGGPSYPPQSTDPQISPRMTEDYTGMQQQTPPNPQSHSQHLLHRGHHHPSQAGHMLAYGARNRVAGEPSQGNIHGGSSNNPYRKEAMDYYLSMGGKDRHRRGGMAYGAGFGYSNMDGHLPHQYRHAGSGSGSSSGMMSPYPLDYGSTAGSGSSSGSSGSGAGAFSPSHQYNMGQNPAMQPASGSQMQHRQHGQNYPTHQALHHGQQHRSYPLSGHRMPPQFSHYSPQGSASTGSSGMYNSPPQRYHEGANSAGFEPKVNSSPNVNSTSNSIQSSATTNNVGQLENVAQSYHSSSYPAYSPQTHSLHKQATLQHRNSQHNLGVGYDNSLKMQHHGLPPGSVYSKHHQAPNPSLPHQASQEIAKSPMHSQPQQTQMNQNFSPISNPSPAASAAQSPSCSSSPSPLMGVSEGHGNPSSHGPSHPPPPNPRSSHSHGRLLQTMPQLSPTPNSNSSISSCGSSGSHKAAVLNAGGAHSISNRGRMGAGHVIGSREEGSASVYPVSSLDKLQDSALNSLNALTSQVANLPNTVQHMLLTDTVLSHKRGKDGGQSQMQQALQAMPSGQPRSRSVSAASSTSTVREGSGMGGGEGAGSEAGADEDSSVMSDRGPSGAKMERDEQFSEGEHMRMRQMSGASSGSEPTGYYPQSQSQTPIGSNQTQSQTRPSDQMKTMSTESPTNQRSGNSRIPPNLSETKKTETHTPSSSSPSSAPQSATPGPNSKSCPPVSSNLSCTIPSPAPPFQSNCVAEPGSTDVDTKNGIRKTREIGAIKDEREKGTNQGEGDREREGHIRQDGQDKENRLDGSSRVHNKNSDGKEGKQRKTQDFENPNQNLNVEEQQNAGGVGVIVSTRSEVNHPEKNNHPQDNSMEEKHSHSFYRESNGEEGIDLSVYSHHEPHQKPNFGKPQNHPHSGPHKYGYPESPYGSGNAMKNRGRPVPEGVMGPNSRHQGFHQPQPNYGPVHSKDVGGTSVEGSKRGEGLGARGHDDNSQLQQPFPSLLQEVLQGYHLDRRYGRAEQALSAHLQAQNMTQHQYQSRHPHGMAENIRTQTGVGEVATHPSQMTSTAKSLQPNQRHGSGPDFGPEPPHPSMRPEVVGFKGSHSASAEKNKMGVSHSTHVSQSAESLPLPPPKHINLADYSLPQRKLPSNMPTSSSAVQELLLQETEPLAGGVGTIGQTESQMQSASLLPPSSERRSVICDVSPNRRSTPERDRESDREREKSQIGASSVIQQPLPSPSATNELGNCKEEIRDKREVEMGMASKETITEVLNLQADHHSGLTVKEADIEYHNKSLHPSVVMNSDPYRRGKVDLTAMASRHPQHASHYPPITNPLSSPSRRQAYHHGVDLSSGHASGFPGYRYGDTREGNMMQRNPHFPSHHPYHSLSPQTQLQNPQSTNKLQLYPHPHSSHHTHDLEDRLEWATNMNRPTKDMMMQPGSSPGRHKLSQSEQRQRMQPQTDMMLNRQHLTKQQLPHQSAYYDMKMWESTHSGRESAIMLEGDPYQRNQQQPPTVSLGSSASQLIPTADPNIIELDVSRVVKEEVVKSIRPTPAPNSMKTASHGSNIIGDVNSVMPQGLPRHNKTGTSGDTNPLMLRRRVRSFISPIPAKRQHQDSSQQRGAQNSYHSPVTHSESSLQNEDDSSSDIPCPRLASPTPGQNTYSQSSSPSHGKTKMLPARKGRGLKLEAIVQKITPNVKKSSNHGDAESNHYPAFSEMSQFSDSQDQDLSHFSRGDEGYLDESHSLNDIMPYRGVDETGPLPPTAYPCDPHQTSQVLKHGVSGNVTRALQPDFDFGLGTTGSSASSDRDKEDLRIATDFTLLGPLPPAPPLPRPVQGSPPPSSSALSDIQHFTNTYQQLETRRGEQSAANLLRQKLQESGIGFDDYSSSDYYGTTPPNHGQLGRQPHQLSSGRSSLSPQDSKSSEGAVPKGYFPSGKKKGRPVGSVNKQKRAQAQAQAQGQSQNSTPGTPSGPTATSPAAAVTPPVAQSTNTTSSDPVASPVTDSQMSPTSIPPILTQAVKVDAESEDTQPEMEVKLHRQRQRGVKDKSVGEGLRGRQRRRRRAPAAVTAKDDQEVTTGAGGNSSISGAFPDNRKCAFSPYVHVERKVAEIGAVCTIVNAEEEKMKGERGSAVGGKANSSGIEALLTSALTSQLPRRDREIERVKEKRETEDVETALQTGKALPSSGYVVSGPVITETSHSGRLLCCLCQKWANYKNLGDLYGPYYPPDYAAKLPKNQPQVRLSQATPGMSRTGSNLDTISNVLTMTNQETQPQDAPPTIKSSTDSDCTVSHATYPTSPATTVGTASPGGGEEMMMFLAGRIGNTSTAPTTTTTTNKTTVLNWDMPPELRPIPELSRQPEPQNEICYSQQNQQNQQQQPQQMDDSQQRPQHRKLTSHPRFKRRHKSSEDSPRMVPSNSKASLPFQPPPPTLDSLGPLAQLAQLPQMPMDPEELWVHEGCIVWSSGVFLVNGRLYGLQEALDGARDTCCSYCEMVGSTLGCYSKGCTLRYHYLCAMEADCSLNEDNFSLRCPKHKVKRESFPRAVGQPSLCTWSSLREDERDIEDEETQESGIGQLG